VLGGAVLVVVPLVGGQDVPGVGLVHDEDMVEGLAPDAAITRSQWRSSEELAVHS